MDKLTFKEYTTVIGALIGQQFDLKAKLKRQAEYPDVEAKELLIKITKKDIADTDSAIETIKAHGWGWEDENERK